MDAKSAQWPQKALKTGQKRDKKLQKVANSRLPILPKAPLPPKNLPWRQRQGLWVPKNRPKIPPKTRAKKLSTIAGCHKSRHRIHRRDRGDRRGRQDLGNDRQANKRRTGVRNAPATAGEETLLPSPNFCRSLRSEFTPPGRPLRLEQPAFFAVKTPWGFGLDILPGLFYTSGPVPGLSGSACRPAAPFRPRRGPPRQAIGPKPKATR